jgi:hypothetical protein
MQRSDAEVKAVEHRVAGEQHADQDEPDGVQIEIHWKMSCSAGFQTCCIADFQVGRTRDAAAGLETRDTADLEVCATS